MRALKRFFIGFGWGILATLAMSLVLALGDATGFTSLEPAPIPVAIAMRLTGSPAMSGGVMVLAVATHFGIGAVVAGLYAVVVRRSNWVRGLGLGICLWLILQLAILPGLGWGPFALRVNSALWLTTLVAHLIYGVAVGALVDRQQAPRRDLVIPPVPATT